VPLYKLLTLTGRIPFFLWLPPLLLFGALLYCPVCTFLCSDEGLCFFASPDEGLPCTDAVVPPVFLPVLSLTSDFF
jgi:hypothetical protein